MYHREWYSKVLLIKRPRVIEQQKQGLNLKGKQRISYDEWIPKENAHFKLIEIESPSSAVVLADFRHQYYKGNKQYIYFSEKSGKG